jgi:(2R)-3-sulfolactate dehydrogenase (NADP+)
VCYDGDNGLGHWQVWEAAQLSSERAEQYGIAAVSVVNSGHCGALGLYVARAAESGKAAIAFSNGPAVIPPWGGRAPVLSTSPIAFAMPERSGAVIVDLATSAVARGKIAEAAAAGRELDTGWAFDAEGQPTTDPAKALKGMLAPIGGPKGYALATMVELLSGVLCGPNLAGDVADPLSADAAGAAQRISHFVIAIDPAKFDVDGRGQERMALYAKRVEDAGGRLPGAGRKLPGDISDDEVLVIPDALAARLTQYASRLGVA